MHNRSICTKCGCSKNLTAHHVLSKHKFPELAFDESNGVALCLSCHNQRHGEERALERQKNREFRKQNYGQKPEKNSRLQEIRMYYTEVCSCLGP